MIIANSEQNWFKEEYPVNHRIQLVWAGGETTAPEGETGTIVKNNSKSGYIIVEWDSGSKSKLFYGNFVAEIF